MCGILAFVINWIAFIPSMIAQTEKYYDIMGSVTYFTITVIACYLSTPLDLQALVVAGMVLVWTLRLGSFLFARVKADGHDRPI